MSGWFYYDHMGTVPREHVPVLTGLLTVVSLALVFGAAGGAIPSTAVPTPPETVLDAIPTINVAISFTAIITISLGWRWIRQGDVSRHRVAMVVSVGLFALFLVLYLYRLVVIGGAADFPGPETIYRFVYLPMLAVHIGLAILCIPLLYYALLLAGAYPVAQLPQTNHRRIGRIAAPLWLTSFALGIVVYVLLHVVY